jgi:hypothetical protein
MANRYFSSNQLYVLRNEISVQMLIEKTLRIPCRVTEGCFRFLCPLCYGFDTSVKPKTNLARCFRCEKNFNTIDLVMQVRKAEFVDSVKFLQSIHQKQSACQDRGILGKISGSNPQDGYRMKLKTPSGKSGGDPCHIGQILGSVLPPTHNSTPEKRFAENKPNNPVAVNPNVDVDRIAKLEHQLEYLGRQIEKIAQTLNSGLPSK